MPHFIRWFDTEAHHPNELLELLGEVFSATKAGTGVVAPYCGSGGDLPLRLRSLESYANWDYFAARFPGLENGLIVTTSGSTGSPKQTLLSRSALEASAEATASALGGHGQWLVALPLHYIAGMQVIFRSLHAGTVPVYAGPITGSDTFRPKDFLAAAERLENPRRYTSLVPTQFEKLLSFLGPATGTCRLGDGVFAERLLKALRRFDAILLGGSAVAAGSLKKAKELGINIVTTYGMTETAGGCVYDGVPLSRTRVALNDGVIVLGGPILACGYLEHRAESPATRAAFTEYGGLSAFRTQDVGHIDRGRLIIDGRRDDIIISGGIKLSPAYLRGRLNVFPEIADSFVSALADPYWGQHIVAVIEPRSQPFDLPGFVAKLKRSALSPAERPKEVLVVEKIPYLPSGKADRLKIRSMIRKALSQSAAKLRDHRLQ